MERRKDTLTKDACLHNKTYVFLHANTFPTIPRRIRQNCCAFNKIQEEVNILQHSFFQPPAPRWIAPVIISFCTQLSKLQKPLSFWSPVTFSACWPFFTTYTAGLRPGVCLLVCNAALCKPRLITQHCISPSGTRAVLFWNPAGLSRMYQKGWKWKEETKRET